MMLYISAIYRYNDWWNFTNIIYKLLNDLILFYVNYANKFVLYYFIFIRLKMLNVFKCKSTEHPRLSWAVSIVSRLNCIGQL